MDPRISIIALGVSDLERSVRFYRDGLGLPKRDGPEGIAFFETRGTWLSLYPREVPVDDPNLLILLRHRAVLFAIVGGLLVASAVHTPLRPTGYAVGLVSMLSFVLIAGLAGRPNAELRRVVVVDLVASAALLSAALLDHLASTGEIQC